MNPDELKYWLAFNRIPHIGRVSFQRMEAGFGVLSAAWKAGLTELRGAGLDKRAAQSVATHKLRIDPDAELEQIQGSGIQALTWHDDAYPRRLKEIYDTPPVLYMRGELIPDDERSIAVVGSRRPSPYGREVAYQLTHDLSRAGVTIVSGLARGIDSEAHKSALKAGGRTVAVLGSGVDVIYPPENRNLAARIVENGALLSEHPPKTGPSPQHFPRRNRIMSGITLGSVVVEAGAKSGALLTARHALEQNREVFAVPGRITDPASRGANRLIRESAAKLILDYKDVLEELNLSYTEQQSETSEQIEMAALFPKDENEAAILSFVTYDPVHIDEVIRSSGLDIAMVSGALAMMELKGMVSQVGGMNYIRLKETPAEYQAT